MVSGPDPLDPLHLINLASSADRLERFTRRNAHLDNVVRYEAVDGSRLDRRSLVSRGYATDDLSYGDGTLGSAMSHVALWEKIKADQRSATIVEDAVVISHEFYAQASKILSILPPDWDFIQWGYGLPPAYVWAEAGLTKIRLEPYGIASLESEDLCAYQRQQVDCYPLRLVHSFGAMAYSMSPRGAAIALEHCLPLQDRFIEYPEAGVVVEDESIDIALSGVLDRMKAFCCIPPLAVRDPHQPSVRTAMDC